MHRASNLTQYPNLIREHWLPVEIAVREVVTFEKRFGLKHKILATHAALPFILTPELLNLIHLNFLDHEAIPWYAETDFLLSALCREREDGLFEVEPRVREVLLFELQEQFGWERLIDISRFLLAYLDTPLGRKRYTEEIRIQRWIALSYLHPDQTVREMADLLKKSLLTREQNSSVLQHQIQIVNALEIIGPIQRTSLREDYSTLLNDSKVLAQILYANDEDSSLVISQDEKETSGEENIIPLLSPVMLQWLNSQEEKATAEKKPKEDNRTLLSRVRFLLEEGQPDRAREALKNIHPSNEEQRSEVEYLRAWSYVQDWSWDNASSILKPLVHSMETEIEEATEVKSREHQQQQHAYLLFYLGHAAVNLGYYEDASHHYAQCLKLLKERRVQPPKVQLIRLRARYSLGMTCIERGLYSSAKQHYEEALRLFEEIRESSLSDLREDVAAIYYGLCDLYRKTGRPLDALEMGKKALAIYEELGDPLMKSRMDNLVGHIHLQLNNLNDASDHLTASLAIATTYDRPAMVLINCSVLAKLRMTEGRLMEAMDYCKLAMDFIDRFDNEHLSGIAYLTTGMVVQAEASGLQGEQKRKRMEDALHYFEQACDQLAKTQAYNKISEAYGRRAEVLEALGRPQEALAIWHTAYKAQADSFGSTLF